MQDLNLGGLPEEILTTILFQARVPMLNRCHLKHLPRLKEQLVRTSPLTEDEFMDLQYARTKIGMSWRCWTCIKSLTMHLVPQTPIKSTPYYAPRSTGHWVLGIPEYTDGRLLVKRTIHNSTYLTDAYDGVLMESHKEKANFLTSKAFVIDTQSVAVVLKGRCARVGIPYRKAMLLEHFAWVCRVLDTVRLFAYLYSELLLHEIDASKYLTSVTRNFCLPNDDPEAYLNDETKGKMRQASEEMKSLLIPRFL